MEILSLKRVACAQQVFKQTFYFRSFRTEIKFVWLAKNTSWQVAGRTCMSIYHLHKFSVFLITFWVQNFNIIPVKVMISVLLSMIRQNIMVITLSPKIFFVFFYSSIQKSPCLSHSKMLKNTIFRNVKIVVHKMTVLIFYANGTLLAFSYLYQFIRHQFWKFSMHENRAWPSVCMAIATTGAYVFHELSQSLRGTLNVVTQCKKHDLSIKSFARKKG